jgi:hypothetical protein
MSTPINAATLIARFDTLVRTPIAADASIRPNYWSGGTGLPPGPPQNARSVLPAAPAWITNYEVLGSGTDTVTTTVVNQGSLITIELFYLLHNMAMALTNIRRIRVFYTLNTFDVFEINDGRRVALPPELAVSFPMPPIPASVVPGQHIKNLASLPLPNEIDDFLLALRNDVAAIRNNPSLAHAHIFSCHSNCHGACHGSRGRR